MRTFSNPEPVTLDISFDEIPTTTEEGIDIIETEEEITIPIDESELNPINSDPNPLDISDEITLKEEEKVEVNPYLTVINDLLEQGLFDPENLYEGFDDEVEPSPEVLKKFIEHNFQLRDKQTIEDFVSDISPLAQRILQYDLNAKGQGLDSYLRVVIEENNLKALDPANEYDQEKILRMWYKDEFSSAEIDEKIEDLKTAGLLSKEASKLKPKLDLKAEAIAKREEESQKMLAQIENQREQGFFKKVEAEIQSGKVDGIPLSKEDGQAIFNLLFAKNVRIPLPEGREVTMSAFEAEVFKHKYSNKGDTKLLLKAALLLTNPDKFYKHFANQVKTEETNKFVKENKYNIIKSQPIKESPKKEVGWYKPK